jgi:hypothetical protein
MRLGKWLSPLAVSLLLATSALAYAQDQREDAKPAPDEARPEAAKPAQDDMKAPRQDEAKPERQDQDKDKEKAARGDEKPAKQDDAKNAKQAERAGGGRIPDDKFRAHFGRQHTFAVNHPTVVNGHPQFQYGGYSFTIVDAWPVGWAYTDQCYIDYIDGEYFIFDLLHPGVQVALVVVL